tara:strand:- start:832 stop:1167 length:336 start_codon:yes stop_codon:yes gene_type:complete
MISNFDNFLNERNFQVVIPHKEKGSVVANFTARPGSTRDTTGKIILMPRDSKALDQLEGLPNFHIQQNLEDALNKEFKREGIIEFRTDAKYPGSGYAFDLVLDKIIKRLNK